LNFFIGVISSECLQKSKRFKRISYRTEQLAESEDYLLKLKENLDRTDDIMLKMDELLGSFDDKLVNLEASIMPIYQGTQHLAKISSSNNF
jgi:hypothetical protein